MGKGKSYRIDHSWGMNYLSNSRTVDQQSSQLRKRTERDPRHPAIILTVYGTGYRHDDGTSQAEAEKNNP